jgi:hypothetical protein
MGEWVSTLDMGLTTCTMAELWALNDDLILVHQHEIFNLVIELDAEILASFFN